MTCAEDLRLRQAYEKALRDWNSSRSNVLRGVRSTETSSAFRRQILTARLKAANDLYDHSLKCADCKMFKDRRFGSRCGWATPPYLGEDPFLLRGVEPWLLQLLPRSQDTPRNTGTRLRTGGEAATCG
jgi:hypothetical protein